MASSSSKATDQDANEAREQLTVDGHNTYSETLIVLVGKEEKAFTVHKAFICKHSGFFKMACSREWKEACERTVRLPEATPSMFNAYLDWVYKDMVKPGDPSSSTYAGATSSPCTRMTRAHFEFYILTDYLQDARLCTRILESLAKQLSVAGESTRLPHEGLLKYAYDNTCEASQLRRFLVDLFVTRGNREQLAAFLPKFPTAFVLDLAKKSMEQTTIVNWKQFQKIVAGYKSEGNE